MKINSKSDNVYIGPKALFDPYYLPPTLLYRKREQKLLFSLLMDSISDDFCLNILYQGIDGIGKKALVNKVINDISMQNEEYLNIYKISINCKEKNFKEIIFSLISDLFILSNSHNNIDSILNSNFSYNWKVFKLLCQKSNYSLFFIFNNIEYLKPKFYKKLLRFGKEEKITIISTVNKILRPNTIDILQEFDFKNKLNFFNYQELYSILKQRVLLTFSHNLDDDIIKYITDLVCEQYVPVPGKGIEILRDLYPLLKDKNNYRNCEVMENCQSHFDQSQISDEFSMLNYITEGDVLNIIFLDNLSNYFTSKMEYYISLNELRELYNISCESLNYKKNLTEFRSITKELMNIGILKLSKQDSCKDNNYFHNLNSNNDFYYMLISPYQLKAIIDAVFNN
ncbi:MAG: hypothetical protein ACFFHD_03160 [Promethearchaeota archaeon]